MQAEKLSKAKINTVKVTQVKVKKSSIERENAMTSIKIDRKYESARFQRREQVSQKQAKAKSHNERVFERVQLAISAFETKLDSCQEKIQARLRNASVLRGSQLLIVKHKAEKLAKPRLSLERELPVAFQI